MLNAVSGYSGGSKMTANYTMIGTGTTGHAEAVEIKYDPKKISYGKILQIFFSVVHDPTQLNRQGPDTGTQYRSAIFTDNDEQKKVAEAYIAQLNAAKVYKKPIVTKVGPLRGVLCGGRLPPGLPDAAPEPALYCLQRHPEDREPEEDLCGELHREADAGQQRQGYQLTIRHCLRQTRSVCARERSDEAFRMICFASSQWHKEAKCPTPKPKVVKSEADGARS